MTRPSQRREIAENAVARRGVSIALTCRAFGVSETCYRYSPKLKDENEEIAGLLVGLTDARKTWEYHASRKPDPRVSRDRDQTDSPRINRASASGSYPPLIRIR